MDNLMSWYGLATETQVNRGMTWYERAREECYGITEQLVGYRDPLHMSKVAAVVAALSPRMPWERNIAVARKIILECLHGDKLLSEVNAGLIGNAAKAYVIYKTDDFNLLGTQKVYRFWHNLAHPDSELVTVDVWAYRAWKGILTGKEEAIPEKVYLDIEQDYITCAREVGIRPYQFQAIVWETIRTTAKGGK